MSATRTPNGAQFPLTIGTAEELGLDPDGGKYVVICEGHKAIVNVDTKAKALKVQPYDFCEDCAEHHYGIGRAS